MKRRAFIRLLGGAAAAWPFTAHAQQPERMRKVGILMPYAESDAEIRARVATFRQELRKLGWAEGENLQTEERWTTDNMDRIRASSAELVNLKPDVILVSGRRVVLVAQQQTNSIPIVFVGMTDPVSQGVVASLARPGGNVTGFTAFEYTIVGKWLEVLKEIAPGVTRVALIFSPDNSATVVFSRLFETAAQSLALQPVTFPVHAPAEIERAIEASARAPNGGVLFPPDVTLLFHRELVVTLAARYHLPAIYSTRAFVAGGGLLSYGADFLDLHRRGASYVNRILRGEKPSELPVQQPTKFELVINLKTAKAIGLTVPPTLLASADEAIE